MKDLPAQITEEVSRQLAQKTDEIFIEGLRRKGYEFKDRESLEQFVGEHCTCEDWAPKQQKTYFVKGKPFLFHSYGIEIELPEEGDTFNIKATNGKFAYL